MRKKSHKVDFCVAGGGLAGMCAAIAAALHGASVALMHDRPVLGGNASSEIRMWVCGARGENNRETGIIEEIQLENRYRNPVYNYSIWDSILYEKVRFEPNITLLLNCSCNDAEMHGNRIKAVTGWQLTTETWHRVEAEFFADCSGDSILAPLSGAEFRVGREAREEFNENIEPFLADRKTMGMSCLIQARETDRHQPFIAPAWAYTFESDADLPHRSHNIRGHCNFWWLELGGEDDSIHDTEEIRDELLKIAFGVWDHVKNHGDHGADNRALEWVGFLPGKRESRRYVGDHIFTQNDVMAEGRFDDLVAYGGWPMDDYHPAGFRHPGRPTTFHAAPSPFGIPYRSLYSRNIENLFFAGRNISATHAAMSATRVMATCATIGQAVGTAASIAAANGISPRQVYQQKIGELQQVLMDDDDCFLPWHTREVPAVTREALISASEGDPEPLRNGHDRPIAGADNGFTCCPGGWVQYSFDREQKLQTARIVFDSELNRPRPEMRAPYPFSIEPLRPPPTLVKHFRIEARGLHSPWFTLFADDNNYQRHRRVHLDTRAAEIRLVLEKTWGADKAHIFAFDVS